MIAVVSASVAIPLLRTGRSIIGPGQFAAVVLVWFFGVTPLLQLSSARFSIYHLDDPRDSFLMAALMTGLYAVGVVLGLRVVGTSSRARSTLASISRRKVRRLVLAYLVIGAVAWLVYFEAMGGFVSFIANLQNRTQLSAGLGYVFLVANLLQVGAALASVCDAAGTRVLPRWLTFVSIAVAFGLVLLLGMRSRALMYVAVLAVAHYALGVRISRARIALVALSGVLIIFAAGKLRLLGSGTGAIFERDEILAAVLADSDDFIESATVDYGHFDRASLVYEYVPRRVEHQLGATIGALALLPIPRKWFPNKPVGAGPLMANAFRAGAWDLDAGWASGTTPTLVGELFLNFSWPGVALGGLVFGVVAMRAYRRWIVNGSTVYDVLQYATFGIFFIVAGTLGEFYGTMIIYGVYALPVALAGRLCATPRDGRAYTSSTHGANP
jgi:hypothetical protein